LAEKKGDYQAAYASADSFHRLQDSFSNEKFRGELVVKEKDHELANNRKFRQQQEEEFESERVSLILFISFLVIVSGILFLLFGQQQLLNTQLKQKKKQITAV